MKTFLLISTLLVLSPAVMAQPTYVINTSTWYGGTYDDTTAPNYTHTLLAGTVARRKSVTYHHYTSLFLTSNKNWFTHFNFDLYDPPGTNADYFWYQGAGGIQGEGGILVFDTLYLNNGAGNSFYINNRNNGFILNGNFEFWNPPGAISVYSRLYFNNGITQTNRQYPLTGAIAFVNHANYVGGLTDAQHVDGFVSESNIGTTGYIPGHGGDFTFPVGNASSAYPLRRQGNFEDFDHIIVVGWVNGDPNITADPTGGTNPTTGAYLGTGINSVSPIGFWDWHVQQMDQATLTPQSLSAAQTITVSIPGLDGLPGLSANDLRLVGFNTATSKWENLSGPPEGAPYATGLVKGSLLTGTIPAGVTIKALGIGSTNAILPVSFVSFAVKGDGCKAKLQWQTGMEQNNSHFVIERSSNGIQFTAIGRMEAAGNSSTLQTYQYTDEAPVTGVNYYRITQVDYDGRYSSSSVKSIRIQCDGTAVSLRAYPNPVTSQVNIQTGKAVRQVNVLNMNGQAVLKYVPSSNAGGTFSVQMHAVQSGIYLLQLINKDGTTDVLKVVKQ
ncbi:MAG: T9SS type A sorting domain-containing protein [Chitinophagaceae bacterium]|nr:T9SS type A sorting domain-containing protein [Chitinophagaceae bacterium]